MTLLLRRTSIGNLCWRHLEFVACLLLSPYPGPRSLFLGPAFLPFPFLSYTTATKPPSSTTHQHHDSVIFTCDSLLMQLLRPLHCRHCESPSWIAFLLSRIVNVEFEDGKAQSSEIPPTGTAAPFSFVPLRVLVLLLALNLSFSRLYVHSSTLLLESLFHWRLSRRIPEVSCRESEDYSWYNFQLSWILLGYLAFWFTNCAIVCREFGANRRAGTFWRK